MGFHSRSIKLLMAALVAVQIAPVQAAHAFDEWSQDEAAQSYESTPAQFESAQASQEAVIESMNAIYDITPPAEPAPPEPSAEDELIGELPSNDRPLTDELLAEESALLNDWLFFGNEDAAAELASLHDEPAPQDAPLFEVTEEDPYQPEEPIREWETPYEEGPDESEVINADTAGTNPAEPDPMNDAPPATDPVPTPEDVAAPAEDGSQAQDGSQNEEQEAEADDEIPTTETEPELPEGSSWTEGGYVDSDTVSGPPLDWEIVEDTRCQEEIDAAEAAQDEASGVNDAVEEFEEISDGQIHLPPYDDYVPPIESYDPYDASGIDYGGNDTLV